MQLQHRQQLHHRCSTTQGVLANSSNSSMRRAASTAQQRCRAASTDTAKAPTAANELVQDIIRLSGSKYGHDLAPERRQQVEAKVKQLEELKLPVKAEMGLLTGTQWTTVYTTSDGTSSGKVGPFITDVVQEFPAEEPGVYYNVSTLGFVSARLRGEYGITRDDKIDLEFSNITLNIGPWKAAEKVFEKGAMRGFWKLSYCSPDFRVFYTNKGNMFVLRRLPQ